MKPLQVLQRVPTPDGGELVLSRRDHDFFIEVNGFSLMSSRAHGSEDALARLAIEALGPRPAPRVLVGGLGMGFTLRATLDAVADRPGAAVVVAELFPVVVEWNRTVLAHLAGRPLADPRVEVVVGDVARQLVPPAGPFDVILLDVDNGFEEVSLGVNRDLYSRQGLGRLGRVLAPGGVVAFWSASEDWEFSRRFSRSGFAVRTCRVRERAEGKGGRHAIVVGRWQGARERQGNGRARGRSSPAAGATEGRGRATTKPRTPGSRRAPRAGR